VAETAPAEDIKSAEKPEAGEPAEEPADEEDPTVAETDSAEESVEILDAAEDAKAEEIIEEKDAPPEPEEPGEKETDKNEAAKVDEFKPGEKKLSSSPLKEVSIDNLEYMVRPFRIKDLPDVMHIEEQSFERPWRRQMFKEELAIPVSKLYTFYGRWQRKDKTFLMGYAVFWIVSEKAHIINFAVAPDERNKGVGNCFLYEILKKAGGLGCKSAYLEVRASANYAHKMLEKSGFSKTSERKDYFGYPKEDAFIYERKL